MKASVLFMLKIILNDQFIHTKRLTYSAVVERPLSLGEVAGSTQIWENFFDKLRKNTRLYIRKMLYT